MGQMHKAFTTNGVFGRFPSFHKFCGKPDSVCPCVLEGTVEDGEEEGEEW